MTEQESLHAAIHEEIGVGPYDPAWPGLFEKERDRLASLFAGVFTRIEHVGSTAVPGSPAKPIIDLLGGVDSMAVARSLHERLCTNGYTTSTEFNDSLPDRQWFMRWANGHRTHHLHVVVYDGMLWREWIGFRDALREDPGLAARYAELKYSLAARHATDREAYTDAKSAFVRSVLERRDIRSD